MSAIVSTPEIPDDPGPSILGSILYADASKVRTTEATWVGLVRAIAAGDQAAFAELYGRTHRLVFTLTMRIVGNHHTAEELTLDVFHQIWKRAASYDEQGGPVLGWIMNQARSRAIDRRRYETRKKRSDPNPEQEQMVEPEPSSEELLQQNERQEQVRCALIRLTPLERQAIEIAFFKDCTYAEVASHLQEPPGTIKTRIRSGLLKLRDELTRASVK
jgi:RNA polymerase sigma-70 factor (ECF subfamily)